MVLLSMKKSIALIKSKGQKYFVGQESVDIMHHKTPNDYDVAKPIAKTSFLRQTDRPQFPQLHR